MKFLVPAILMVAVLVAPASTADDAAPCVTVPNHNGVYAQACPLKEDPGCTGPIVHTEVRPGSVTYLGFIGGACSVDNSQETSVIAGFSAETLFGLFIPVGAGAFSAGNCEGVHVITPLGWETIDTCGGGGGT